MILAGWLGAAAAVLVAALPPPPETVVRETKSFGTITIPHAKHLSARIACRACHGSGRVGKIEFTPKTAHATCRNCHIEVAKGPVDCRGCHVVSEKQTPAVAEQAGPETPLLQAAPAAAGAAAEQPRTFAVAAASSHIGPGTGGAPGPDLLDPPELRPRARFGRVAEAGVSVMAGQRQALVVGPTFQLTARTGPNVMQYGLTFAGGKGVGRTQFLVGGGREWEVAPHFLARALAVGGLDAIHSPVSMLPAVGLRAGLEFSGRSPWTLGVSATALADLMHREVAGEQVGGFTFSMGASAGWRLP